MFGKFTFVTVISFILLAIFPATAQTLFTYGNKQVSTKAFLKAFHKNPGEGHLKKAMEDYLPLYINYVLKVQDAYDLQLDTLAKQKEELKGYKLQLAEGYLAEKAGSDALIDEVIKRMQEEVLLGHIFIQYGNGDTVAAVKAASEAAKKLASGKKWEEVAKQYSTDEDVVKNAGVVGWIGPFLIPYDYESLVYKLPKGGVTQPIPATGGIHIFSKRNTRVGMGAVQVAQILLASWPGMDQAALEQRSRLADSLYNLIGKGSSFEKLVADYSQDRTTKNNNGILPPFSVGTYDAAFETQAFALEQPGDVSKPFKTEFGWHILKLVSKTPPPDKADENARNLIRPMLATDGRQDKAKEEYVKSKLPAMKFKSGTQTKKQLQQYTDSLLINGDTKASGLTTNSVLFSLGKQFFTIADWQAFARVKSISGSLKKGDNIENIYNAFIISKALDYLPEHLDELEPEFAEQFKEFKDANLLFEAMEQKVWNKSATDTTGLLNFYTARKANYSWGENVVGVMVTANDSALIEQVRGQLAKDISDWRSLNDRYEGQLYADSGRYEINAFTWAKGQQLKPGMCTPITSSEAEGNFTFACITETGKAGLQRSFEEARGYAISDYQQVLEEAWVEHLKKKYPVKVNEGAWKKLLDNAANK